MFCSATEVLPVSDGHSDDTRRESSRDGPLDIRGPNAQVARSGLTDPSVHESKPNGYRTIPNCRPPRRIQGSGKLAPFLRLAPALGAEHKPGAEPLPPALRPRRLELEVEFQS